MAAREPADPRDPRTAERYLIPGARGDRRDAVAISEANAGSDFSAASTTATPDGNGGYIINGEKWFVTVGDVADYLIVLANVEPEHAATIFLIDVDTPGVKIKHIPATRTPSSTSTPSSRSRTCASERKPCSVASDRATTSPATGSLRSG